ncbi:MAG: efflux RND transporter periplasmic adaptor subunit [Bacteroidales bacterium]|nr:efflux RND transporter periplasmic adaptor subunit [Bacteroidales bacterium]
MNRTIINSFNCLIICVLLFVSCKPKSDNEAENAAKNDFVAEKNLVDTMRLVEADFFREVVSNGTLKGTRRAELRFVSQGEIATVYVKNGSYVRKGDPIVALDTSALSMSMQKAEQTLEKAHLDLLDNLISNGYGSDTAKVPNDLLNVAKIRSGYASAVQDYAAAKMNLANARLTAPFSGIVANLKAKPYEQSGDVICLIIDNTSFDVEFKLLESELSYVRVGQGIRISPFVDLTQNYNGTVKEINPYVDEKGQVAIVASISNRGSKLVEGMNVKVFIESKKEKQLIVPKSAVVIRDGYDVLFTLNPDTNKAGWVYVDVLQSNSTHHVVRGSEKKSATLKEGAIVIISGNLNLADGSKVEIKKR